MDKYQKTDGRVSYFDIYPEKSAINGEVIEYHYFDYQLIDGDEIYLEIQYTEENFKKEIERLENVTYTSELLKYHNAIKKDDCVLFNYLTYVTRYNDKGQYEYACVDSENYKIVYITLNSITLGRISFDKAYLPKTYYIVTTDWSQEDNIDPYYFDMYDEDTVNWYN